MVEYAVTDKILANLNKKFEFHLPLAEASINYNSEASNTYCAKQIF